MAKSHELKTTASTVVLALVLGGQEMAYPERIPVIRSEDAEESEERLKSFKMSRAQKEFYKEGQRTFELRVSLC
jgi:CRISPR/Cas system-associated protein Cas7 (RAMP superfamily)